VPGESVQEQGETESTSGIWSEQWLERELKQLSKSSQAVRVLRRSDSELLVETGELLIYRTWYQRLPHGGVRTSRQTGFVDAYGMGETQWSDWRDWWSIGS